MYLQDAYLNSFKESTPSAGHESEKHVSVAASKTYYLISPGFRYFCVLYSTKLQQNIYFVKFLLNLLILISSRGGSRTPIGTKIGFFVTISNESQPPIVVTKNLILDATDVLDPTLSKIR